MGALGGFIGPSLIGFLADDSDEDDYDAAMVAVGIFMMCAGVLMLGQPLTESVTNIKDVGLLLCTYQQSYFHSQL